MYSLPNLNFNIRDYRISTIFLLTYAEDCPLVTEKKNNNLLVCGVSVFLIIVSVLLEFNNSQCLIGTHTDMV